MAGSRCANSYRSQDLGRETQFLRSGIPQPHSSFPRKGKNMKTNRRTKEPLDARHVAVLLGVSIGLGIVVHQSFLVVAGAIAVGALAVATARAAQEHSEAAHRVRPRR